ncbi:MAG TPA: response regulator [Ktedonobacteraceae bacterium]|nr:response regulator [Ktedonobacteraceae bacterium]
MSDPLPLDSNELTPDDLDVIRDFLATEDFATTSDDDSAAMSEIAAVYGWTGALDEAGEEEEMLSIFVTEVDEDIADMQSALALLRQDQTLAILPALTPMLPSAISALSALRRCAHKIRGTSAAIGCKAMSTIAHSVETMIEQANGQQIEWQSGMMALGFAIDALRETLESVATHGQESILPLLTLEERYADLHLPLDSTGRSEGSAGDEPDEVGGIGAWRDARRGDMMEDTLHAPEWAEYLAKLLSHVEQLAERQHEIEDARREVDTALAELRASQARLRRIETLVAALPISSPATAEANGSRQASIDELAPSSLVARILRESAQRTGHDYQPRQQSYATQSPFASSASLAESMLWDELELDHFTETHMLSRSLNEAIADVATTTAQLQLALLHLDALNRQQASMTLLIRDDARSLQIAPELDTPYEARGATPGLLVRVGDQHAIVPFSQTLRIDYSGYTGQVYALGDLLGLPPLVGEKTERVLPLLLVRPDLLETPGVTPDEQRTGEPVAVQVDEALGQVELRVKPLPLALRRPGITGAVITRTGEVALAIDLPTLIRRHKQREQGLSDLVEGEEATSASVLAMSMEGQDAQLARSQAEKVARVLIVDDSVYMRRSLAKTLASKGYKLFEARDGVEALEQLMGTSNASPDVLLLDLEMPNLNGYELLNILRTRALLPDLKIILLTSRASDKHQKRARDLGIHAYLTKPCSEETLLETVAGVLGRR